MTKEEILRNNSQGQYMNDTVYDGSIESVYDAMEEYARQQEEAAFRSSRERLKDTNGMIHFDSGDTTPHYPYAFRNYEQYKK